MTVNKLYLEINCEFNHSSIVLYFIVGTGAMKHKK